VRGPGNLLPTRTRKRGHELAAEGLNYVTVNLPLEGPERRQVGVSGRNQVRRGRNQVRRAALFPGVEDQAYDGVDRPDRAGVQGPAAALQGGVVAVQRWVRIGAESVRQSTILALG
jgi:hypothetical protein